MVASILIFAMVTNTPLSSMNVSAEEVKGNTYVGVGYEVTFSVISSWDTAYTGEITIKNTSDKPIENWCIDYGFNQEVSNIWNATIQKNEYGRYVIKNAGWNQDIPAGQSVTYGFTANGTFTEFPSEYFLLGKVEEVSTEAYTIAYEIVSDWGTGFNGKVTITNKSDKVIEDWAIDFNFANEISNIWDATIANHTETNYQVKCNPYNQNIEVNESVSFGFTVTQTFEGKVQGVVVHARKYSFSLPLSLG